MMALLKSGKKLGTDVFGITTFVTTWKLSFLFFQMDLNGLKLALWCYCLFTFVQIMSFICTNGWIDLDEI